MYEFVLLLSETNVYMYASAITKGVFNATKDYASPFDVDGHGMLRRIDGRAHDSTLLS